MNYYDIRLYQIDFIFLLIFSSFFCHDLFILLLTISMFFLNMVTSPNNFLLNHDIHQIMDLLINQGNIFMVISKGYQNLFWDKMKVFKVVLDQ